MGKKAGIVFPVTVHDNSINYLQSGSLCQKFVVVGRINDWSHQMQDHVIWAPRECLYSVSLPLTPLN